MIKISLFTLLQTNLFCDTVVYEKTVSEVSHVYELQKYCRSEMKLRMILEVVKGVYANFVLWSLTNLGLSCFSMTDDKLLSYETILVKVN